MFPSWKEQKLFYVLTAVLYVYAIIWFGASIQSKLASSRVLGKALVSPATIVVSGEGKITAAPNISKIDLGLLTEKLTVQEAQKENSEKMNRLIEEIKKLAIEDKDIQTTQYQIYPQYDYEKGERKIRGYSASQSVNVKIRDLAKISALLGKAGEVGANQVGGLQFTIDDEESLRGQARTKAIAAAQAKANELAKTLGVKLVRLTAFNESGASPPSLYALNELSYGGEDSLPRVESGSLDIKVSVNLTYEVE